MSVDFTPSRGEYTELKPFRYWCQKVLPLVYDDSLSYYELLSKILDALNKAMEDVETLNDDVTALYEAYTSLQNWVTAYAENLQNWVNNYVETFFEGEGIADAVDAGIDRMVVSGEFGSIVNDKVAAQINAVVASQLGTVVQGQLPSVVQTQIPGVVSSQLPGVVNNQIGDIVEDWLEANITPDTTLLDRTINATNKAPVAYDMKTMLQAMKSNYSFIDKYTMFDYPGDISTGRNDLAVMEYMTRTYGETVSNKTVFMDYFKKGNSLILYNPSSNEVHCYPSLIPITRNLLPPLSADFAVVSQTMPTIPNVATSYNKNAILNYFVNLKSNDTVKVAVDITITNTGSETPVVCLTGWKLVKIYVSNNNIVTQNLANFIVTGSVTDGYIHAECEYTFGDINREAYDDPATVGFGLAILTGDTSVELTTYQESGFEEGVTYSDNTNFFPKDTGFNISITGEVVDTEIVELNKRFDNGTIPLYNDLSNWFNGYITANGTLTITTKALSPTNIPFKINNRESINVNCGTLVCDIGFFTYNSLTGTFARTSSDSNKVGTFSIASNSDNFYVSLTFKTNPQTVIEPNDFDGSIYKYTEWYRHILGLDVEKLNTDGLIVAYTDITEWEQGYFGSNGVITASSYRCTPLSTPIMLYTGDVIEIDPGSLSCGVALYNYVNGAYARQSSVTITEKTTIHYDHDQYLSFDFGKTPPGPTYPSDFDGSIKISVDWKSKIYDNSSKIANLETSIENGNYLAGKKLVACGDSITAAVNPNGGNFNSYAKITAQRNNMVFEVNAVSGSTMTNVAGKNPFCVDRYQNVPSDFDYLTIWFGYNDGAYAQLGTINDTEDTTFYGAYKKVLDYYLTTYPTKKIGLIVPYMSDTGFQQAVRDMSEMYGVPCLDLPDYKQCSIVWGSANNAQTARKNALTYDGTHPNQTGHEFISTMFEQFLLRL